MHKKWMLGVAVGTVLALGGAGGAFAGEIGGNGQETQGPAHAKSLCVYSGLEDGSEGGPSGPGNTQNWGQIPQELRKAWSDRGAAVVSTPFGEEGCNAHLYPAK
ncbi:hypothetical protein [Microbacterium sp. BK668]|uniref:hypothetical protein n=1 Tax=Microbacterium sp. BK668 TaxID=2512118 RepID=UPI00105F5DAB|nr:hypothetical protein [Microbacterium sp. BK668]TDN88490.1 hypothetical protein EV279_2932 [Microbacterium sp. BK668]